MMNGSEMFFGGSVMWIFLILIVVALIAVIKMMVGGNSGEINQKEDKPLEILKKRYALGEIDEQEFNRRRKELEGV